ncbi:MAG: glycine cleavage system aminomethyltransferase GcvT [Leptospiraceae bacterium]|nr:glycine cleavage system aminomethyltransferase GcvT [Leptospiraceae bacterium]
MTLKRTYLLEEHKKLKARLVPFAGWEMPVQYTSIIEEHLAVRNHVGIFDVSHMGEIQVKGKDAISFLEQLTPNTIEDQKIYQIRYNAILNHDGGVKDDVTIFRESNDSFFIIVNASNVDKIWQYLNEEKSHQGRKELELINQSDEYSMLAIQGPEAENITIEIFKDYANFIKELKYYYFSDIQYHNEIVRISRTGYTGEDGFEILCNHKLAIHLWNEFINHKVIPCGLGARDSLRLEAMYPLYGHELKEDRTPVESGIGWIVKEKDVNYYAKEKLLNQKKNNPEKIIVPFVMIDKGIPREGYKVYGKEFTEGFSSPPCLLPEMLTELDIIGEVQSGLYSPSLKTGIGTAFLPFNFKNTENEICIEIRDKMFKAKVHKGAFVKGTAGKKK